MITAVQVSKAQETTLLMAMIKHIYASLTLRIRRWLLNLILEGFIREEIFCLSEKREYIRQQGWTSKDRQQCEYIGEVATILYRG